MRNVQHVHEETTVGDVSKNIPRIYAVLENRQADRQSNMIEVEGKIVNQPIAILIDLGESHSYIAPNLVERFHLERNKYEESWMVQLATGTKKKINEIVKGFPSYMNCVSTTTNLNTIPHDSYDVLIGIDWLDAHHVVLDCIIRLSLVLMVKRIPKPISIKEISSL
jgi:hypothetical protein